MKLNKEICQIMATASEKGEISDNEAVKLLNMMAEAAKSAPADSGDDGDDSNGQEDDFLAMLRGYGERQKRK